MKFGVRLVAVSAVVATIVSLGPAAQAISPAQNNPSGVVTLLGNGNTYSSIADFWSRTFRSWGRTFTNSRIYFYGGSFGHQNTPCGSTTALPNNGFYCGTSHSIHLDYNFMQYLITQLGDYGNGSFLAHEYGHAIQRLLGYGNQGYRSEYHADCLMGMFTRYGYSTGRLNGNDYWEGYYWLYNQPSSNSHGTAAGRTSWYRYGYESYSLSACNQVFNGSYKKGNNSEIDADDPIVERPQDTTWRFTDEQQARFDRAIGKARDHGFDPNPPKGLPEE